MIFFVVSGQWGYGSDSQNPRVPIDLGATDFIPQITKEGPAVDEDAPLLDLGSKFLYDAESFGFDKDATKGLFKGDVVLIGGASILTADVITFDSKKQELSASGHVIFLSANQLFLGTTFTLQYETGEFKVQDAVMIANDPNRVQQVVADILGMSQEELVFESAKSSRLAEVERKKLNLRMTVVKNAIEGKELSDQQVDLYALLLEQQGLIKKYESPHLAAKGEEARNRLRKRRHYWQESRQESGVPALKKNYFLRLSGSTLEKVNEYDYYAYDAIWTPCRCADDEEPAWSFRADRIKAQEEGYIDLSHPILMVKGVPVLYIPFLRVPFKSKRQSGFLMPGFQSGDQKNGFVYTQPVFFAFADNYDATLTWDLFQKRGTRLGMEARYEAREHSGFEFKLETIRDRSWVLQGAALEHLREHYTSADVNYCARTLGDTATAGDIAACEEKLLDYLKSPDNSWRGKKEWEGKYFLTPHLSLATKGTLVSDHRYIEDLYLPEDYTTAFTLQNQANAYSTAKLRINYDNPDYFLGIGTSHGDSAVSSKQFEGLQIASKVNFRTRMFSLNPQNYLNTPIYSNIEVNQYLFQENKAENNPTVKQLGAGEWRQVKSSLISPVVREGILRLDHFSEIELRQISHPGLDENDRSSINSWRSGLSLNLPIDGMAPLPKLFQDEEDFQQEKYLHHIMNWSLTYSARPSVARRGPYANQNANGASLVYFATDRRTLVSDGRDVSAEDTMIPHQRLTFSSSHRWLTFDRGWGLDVGKIPQDIQVEEKIESLHDQARRELLYSLDHPISGDVPIFEEDESGNVNWYINRYRLSDSNHYEPISLNVSTTFDFEREKLRQETIQKNQLLEGQAATAASEAEASAIRKQIVSYHNLPESWSGPYFNLGLNWGGYRLSSTVTYNTYKRASTAISFILKLPTFWKTGIGVRYLFQKSPEPDSNTGALSFSKTKTTYLSLSTGLIPYISTGINLIRKEFENGDSQYATSVNLSYGDTSGCWGMRFIREKDLLDDEKEANYILQLSVIFFGNSRSGDLSPALEREIPRFTFHK